MPPYDNKLGPHRRDKGKIEKPIDPPIQDNLDANRNHMPLEIPSSPVEEEEAIKNHTPVVIPSSPVQEKARKEIPLVNLEDVSSDDLIDVDEEEVRVAPTKKSMVTLEDITSDELTVSDKEDGEILVISIKKRRHSYKPRKKNKDEFPTNPVFSGQNGK